MAAVSDEDHWVFVHIPKSGGHALHDYLRWRGYRKTDLVAFGDHPSIWEGTPIEMHAPASVLRSWMRQTGRDWEAYDSVAVIRDPVDRVLSIYSEISSVEEHGRAYPYWKPAGADWWDRFDQIRDVNEFVAEMLDPWGPQRMLRPQRWYVTDHLDQVIVKHLIRRSHMSSLVPQLIKRPGTIPRVRVRGRDQDHLSAASVDAVRARYAEDLELFESSSPR